MEIEPKYPLKSDFTVNTDEQQKPKKEKKVSIHEKSEVEYNNSDKLEKKESKNKAEKEEPRLKKANKFKILIHKIKKVFNGDSGETRPEYSYPDNPPPWDK